MFLESANQPSEDKKVEADVTNPGLEESRYASRRHLIKYESVQEGRDLQIDSDIIEAAKLANAHDFIKTFPQ